MRGGALQGARRADALGFLFLPGPPKSVRIRFRSVQGVSEQRRYGRTLTFSSKSFRGGNAVRNSCPICGSRVFGGIVGQDNSHTIYAGTLDDPSSFGPQIAILNRDRPAWALLPPGLNVFETMPLQ